MEPLGILMDLLGSFREAVSPETFQDNSGLGWTSEVVKQTALHAAASDPSSKQDVKDLVDFWPPELLELQDRFGRTALHIAAMVGNTEAAEILVGGIPGLIHRVDDNLELPLHLAARHAHKKTVLYLLKVTDEQDPEVAFYGPACASLLELLIIADFYDIALEVLKRCLDRLSRSHDSLWQPLPSSLCKDLLEMLAKRPEAFARLQRSGLSCLGNSLHYMKGTWQFGIPKSTDRADFKYPHAIDLLRHLIREILEREQESSATEVLGRQLCTAAKLGNYEAAGAILGANPQAFWFRDEDGHTFLQISVLNRHESFRNLLSQRAAFKQVFWQTQDRKGNNLLHFAARRQPSSTSSAALQVQQDLRWLEEMERNVPPSLKSQTNNDGKTPREVFSEEHENLLKDGDEWMKKTAKSCTVVAALVVTVVFAAAFTVPGGTDSNGIPNYLTNASFLTFAISNTLGLVSSTTSLLMFLSILTSRFSKGDLLNTGQYMRLCIGLLTLLFSLASLLVTFAASIQIVLGHWFKWIWAPIGILASVPAILFARLQCPLLLATLSANFGPIFSFREEK